MEKLRISENNRYFMTASGKTFTWIADTAWTMPQRMKWDDVEYYMQKRKNQGFTVLQIVALDPERDVEMRNPAGEKALPNDDPKTPNEAYFRYLDWILDRAEHYGFYVLLLPVWGQLVTGDDWGGGTYPKIVTEENAYEYGRWIGERYRNRNNILWCLGGDRQPIHKGCHDYRDVWRRMAEGLAEGVTGHVLKYNEPDPLWEELLITYHACHEAETGECSTMSYWDDNEAWIRFIMLQSGHGLKPKNYEIVKREYDRKKVMPVWDGEPAYEMMPTTWPITDAGFHDDWMVRKRAYWSLLAGAFGYTYGHSSVWCMVSEKEKNAIAVYDWYESLHSVGSDQMRHLHSFMEALSICTCIPCQNILLEQRNSKEDVLNLHVQAAKDPSGKFVCVYFPSGGAETLDMQDFATDRETLFLWWYNPRDGKFYTPENEVTEKPIRKEISKVESEVPERILKVSAPGEGPGSDWILLVFAEETAEPVRAKSYYEFSEKAEEQKVFEW